MDLLDRLIEFDDDKSWPPEGRSYVSKEWRLLARASVGDSEAVATVRRLAPGRAQ